MIDREQDELATLERQVSFWHGAYMNERHTNADLKRHLRDRDAHIANLEAQLLPLMSSQVVIEMPEQPELL